MNTTTMQPSLMDQSRAIPKDIQKEKCESPVNERPTLSPLSSGLSKNGMSGNDKIRTMAKMGVFSQVQKCENNWREKVNQFALKTEEKEKSKRKVQKKQRDFLSLAKSERKTMVKSLFKESCRRHHPRRVILDFFNDVAREGAHDVEEEGTIKTHECLHPMLRYFNRASVFTVWRPTSMDAMIRMIRCEAVGKGLDIKAKSARRGKLSGFVPFLQMSGNDDEKNKIKLLPKNGRVRLFFRQEEKGFLAEITRAKVITILERVAHETRSVRDLGGKVKLSTLSDVTLIDDYAPSCFGLEISMHLLWEAFIVDQDITCEKGSMNDIGRESCPRNQDLNISAAVCNKSGGINSNNKQSDHRVVILQTAGLESPMNPFGLLMAYEMEDKKEVLPVVSDCDCFLVGTRRVTYQTPMDPEQVEVMKWSISEMNTILKTTAPNDCNWSKEWSHVLENAAAEGFEPKIPGIGFGDPKSCSIMENAVNRLIGSGSGGVRHGAECFNYHCPQEIEDEFIIIADNLPGDLPWMKVNLEELHDFLDEKISSSFTFPLNPKWILCDGGRWRDHYDKLMASENHCTQESMNIWFPNDVREQIEHMRTQYPHGLFPDNDRAAPNNNVVTHNSMVSPSSGRNRGFWSSLKKKKLTLSHGENKIWGSPVGCA